MLIESYIWFIVYFFVSKELIACGSANILGSFFSCFPVSGSLSRSVIQESIARTQVFKNNKLCYKQSLPVMQLLFLNLHFLFIFFFQLCTIPVVIVIILVLLFIAPLFYHLPKVSKRQCLWVYNFTKISSSSFPGMLRTILMTSLQLANASSNPSLVSERSSFKSQEGWIFLGFLFTVA